MKKRYSLLALLMLFVFGTSCAFALTQMGDGSMSADSYSQDSSDDSSDKGSMNSAGGGVNSMSNTTKGAVQKNNMVKTVTNSVESDDEGDDSISNTSKGAVQKNNIINTSAKDVRVSDDSNDDEDLPSKVDANGNLTIRMDEDYKSAINLTKGDLTLKSGATVLNNVVVNGNVKMESNTTIKGNLTVRGGTLTMASNVTVTGGIIANNLTSGTNLDVEGPVIVSGVDVMTIGDNSDIKNTLTSKAGLIIGSNSNVKLFLSGDTAEVDGKVYKLGGKVLKEGSNTDVVLPVVPKLKNADGTEVKITNNVQPTSLPPVTSSSETDGAKEESANSNNYYNSATAMAEVEKIVNVEDLNAYVTKVSGIETNVSDLNLSGEAVDMDYKVPASLFGFIPTTLPANVKVSKDKNVDVAFPWYSFMFSTPTDEETIKGSVSSAVKSSFDGSKVATEALTAKMQASITNSVLSSLKSLFGGKK